MEKADPQNSRRTFIKRVAAAVAGAGVLKVLPAHASEKIGNWWRPTPQMDAMTAIRTRRSVRSFTDEPVTDNDIREMLGAAMSAPSAANEQPWEFVVIRDKETLGKVGNINRYAGYARKAPQPRGPLQKRAYPHRTLDRAVKISEEDRTMGKAEISVINDMGYSGKDTGSQIQPLSSSKGLGWRGVHVERAQVNGFECNDESNPNHLLAMVTRKAYSWERKTGNGYTRHTSFPGQLWINPANTPFSHRSRESKEFIHLALDPAWLTTQAGSFPRELSGKIRRRYHVEDDLLKQLILMLLREAETGGKNGPLFSESLATALAIHVAQNYADAPAAPRQELKGALSRSQLKRAKEFMEAHLTSPITLEDIAREIGASKFHFSRMFKKTTGTCFHGPGSP